MAKIIRTKQPQQPVAIRAGLPIPTALFLGSAGLFNYLKNTPLPITGTVDFLASGGGKSVGYGADTNRVELGSNSDLVFTDNSNATIVVYRRKRDTTNRPSTLFATFNANTNCQVNCPWTDGNIYFTLGPFATGEITVSGQAFSTSPESYVFLASATRGREVWRNGILLGSDVTKTAARAGNTTPFNLGSISATGLSDNEEIYLAAVFATDLPAVLCKEISENPWSIFAPLESSLILQAPSGVSLNPGAASLVITGYAPSVAVNQQLQPGAASLAITGYAPAVAVNQQMQPGAASLTITGYAPTVQSNQQLQPGASSLAITGDAPSVAVNQQIHPAAASLSISGFAPSVAVNQQIKPAAASLTITGYAPTVQSNQQLEPGSASLAITGYAPTVQQGNETSINPGVASLNLTGYAPSVAVNQQLEPGAASLTLTGYAPTVIQTFDTAPVVIQSFGGGGGFSPDFNHIPLKIKKRKDKKKAKELKKEEIIRDETHEIIEKPEIINSVYISNKIDYIDNQLRRLSESNKKAMLMEEIAKSLAKRELEEKEIIEVSKQFMSYKKQILVDFLKFIV